MVTSSWNSTIFLTGHRQNKPRGAFPDIHQGDEKCRILPSKHRCGARLSLQLCAVEVREEYCTAYRNHYECKYNHFATIYHFAIILQMLMLNRNLIWLQ
jgi:hypothetical protein